MSIPQMSEAELDAYLEQVAREGSDEELESLITTIKGLQNQYIQAKQKAWQEAAMDDWAERRVKEDKREAELLEARAKHEKRIAKAEELLRRERSWDPSRGT